MTQARHLLANVTDVGNVDRCDGRPHLHTGIGQNGAPWIDHHRVTMALSTAVMKTGLCRSQDVGGVFNGTGLKQNLPVVLSGECREGRGNHQQFGPRSGEMAIQLREAHVVADGYPHTT